MLEAVVYKLKERDHRIYMNRPTGRLYNGVTSYKTAEGARRVLERNGYDVVVTDNDSDALDAVRALKARREEAVC